MNEHAYENIRLSLQNTWLGQEKSFLLVDVSTSYYKFVSSVTRNVKEGERVVQLEGMKTWRDSSVYIGRSSKGHCIEIETNRSTGGDQQHFYTVSDFRFVQ